ncbi:unnamed protein product [Chilo suppressalis]|uniref:Protein rolling stone n=1 Tax=Chilo suppressalis TaxID=168631 RepID=A0ABN8BE77_CHISP|nr:hypothetical protein evm_004238 [Chilo suppressalis]CAH0405235.1 unnamed protein product [Chilo suppressalis]
MKKYFRDQFSWNRFKLEHEEAWDFYLCCWQRNRSPLPLLLVRLIVFLGCLSILVTSMVMTGQLVNVGYWFIYMTHWGLILITVTAGLAFVVSARAYFRGPIDSTFGVPWYLKSYWAAYNVTLPTAFFITIFYYILLTDLGEQYSVDPVLDLFIHGINSVLMFVLLLTSQHPFYLLHFYQALAFALVYMVFSIIYFFSGGLSPIGERWIYPMIDWSDPGPTVGIIFVCAAGLIIMHSLVALLTVCRDYISKKYVRNMNSMTIAP